MILLNSPFKLPKKHKRVITFETLSSFNTTSTAPRSHSRNKPSTSLFPSSNPSSPSPFTSPLLTSNRLPTESSIPIPYPIPSSSPPKSKLRSKLLGIYHNGISPRQLANIHFHTLSNLNKRKYINKTKAYIQTKQNVVHNYVSRDLNKNKIISDFFKTAKHSIETNLTENKLFMSTFIRQTFSSTKSPNEKKVKIDNAFPISSYKKQKTKLTTSTQTTLPSSNLTYTHPRKTKIRHTVSNYYLQKEVKAKITTIKNEEISKTKRDQLKKWTKVITNCSVHFKRLGITIEQFYNSKKLYNKPYQHEKAYELFNTIKHNERSKYFNLIRKDKSLVYSFDHFHQTILHWLAKRNRYDWISFAVYSGAVVNAVDSTGRTPLHIAVDNNSVEAVMVLLYEMAYPFYKDNCGNVPLDLSKTKVITDILKRTVLLYIIHSMGKENKFVNGVKRGLKFLYIEEMNINFSSETFLLYDKVVHSE